MEENINKLEDVINYTLVEDMQDASNEMLWDAQEALGDILKKRLINCYTRVLALMKLEMSYKRII